MDELFVKQLDISFINLNPGERSGCPPNTREPGIPGKINFTNIFSIKDDMC